MNPSSPSSFHNSESWRSGQITKSVTPNAKPASFVFLIDDDAGVRRALGRLIKSAGYQLQAFASAREFLASDCRTEKPACLVLDVHLRDLSGLDLQNELNRGNANLPIVFITGHGNIPMSVKAMKSGAVDFLAKPIHDTDLLRAVEQALARAARENAQRDEMDSIKLRIETLTPREKEVMMLVVKGFLNKQIAFDLGTTEKTIKVHRARVMDKMDVGSLAELVRVAARVGIGEGGERTNTIREWWNDGRLKN